MRRSTPICLACIGHSLDRWLCPQLLTTEAQAMGLDLEIDRLDPTKLVRAAPNLAQMLDMLVQTGYAGALIASPYKWSAARLVDVRSLSTEASGAVTTVVVKDGELTGYNALTWAARQHLRHALGKRDPGRVILLGAGATGASLASALCDLKVQALDIYDLIPERAARLVAHVNAREDSTVTAQAVTNLPQALAEADGIVNATPLGRSPMSASPIPFDTIRPGHWVADVHDDPFETTLIRATRAVGGLAINAVCLTVFRTLREFHLLTGKAPDLGRLRNAMEAKANEPVQ
ncbi:MAG: hypothetical protein AAGF79_05540 [Pseudomonadota bacterium]